MRDTVTQARTDLYDSVADVENVTILDHAPSLNELPAGPSGYVSPDGDSKTSTDWTLTFEVCIPLTPTPKEAQTAMWALIDGVEAAFDAVSFASVWSTAVNQELGVLVATWQVTVPREDF